MNRSGLRHGLWVGAAVVLGACLGCGDSQIPVYPVQGTVKFEGKPLPGGGAIAFVPLGRQEGKTAGGEVAADGTYRLTTRRDGDGCMAGEFRVVIAQVAVKEGEKTRDGEKTSEPVVVVAEGDRIPAVYSDHLNSPLRATVEPKGSNEINLELKRQ